jgi:outer membrane protein assembly factor BamB
MRTLGSLMVLLVLAGAVGPNASGADWPQYMRNAERTGDAADEVLRLPLGLVAQVKLEDMIMTSPAVVGGRVYVIDQMGTAYCIDPRAGRILWKKSPEGDKAMGSNTSSPCVVKGKVYYGTTAGNFHILSASDGKLVKTVKVGSPIISAITQANESVYFQALDAVVRCLDLEGGEKWTWDHYKRYKEPPEVTKKNARRRGHPGSYDRPHYGGGEVAVSGTRVLTGIGWDLVCLEDKGKAAELAWCRRCPRGRDGGIPMSSSISQGWVYTATMGADGVLALMRTSLKDGSNATKGAPGLPYSWSTPAVREAKVVSRSSHYCKDSLFLFDCEAGKNMGGWGHPSAAIPVIASPTLAKEHCLVTTLRGGCLVFGIEAQKGKSFQLQTPNGKGIGSSPVISGGNVLFGCDDGYLYVYGPGGTLRPTKDDKPMIAAPRSKVISATGKSYGWPTAHGNAGNTGFVDDPGLKPPLKVRWATRGFGHFKVPCIATDDGDVISLTINRTVTCQEQATGRMRWRLRLPPAKPAPTRYGEDWPVFGAGPLYAEGKVFVSCPSLRKDGKLVCLDVKDGQIIWTAEIGAGGQMGGQYVGTPLIFAGGRVILPHVKKGAGLVAEAWESKTGKSVWQVPFDVDSDVFGGGCSDGKVVYFTWGRQGKPRDGHKPGQTIAVNAKSGSIVWQSSDIYGKGSLFPLLVGERLFLSNSNKGPMCVSAKDGKLLWKPHRESGGILRSSIGPDFMVTRGYGGGASKRRLDKGQNFPVTMRGGQLGADTHSCSPVALTASYSLASSVGGLNIRSVTTGALIWCSPGFAPRGCQNVALANGRVFWPSSASGVIFCWEPKK